MTQAKLKIEKMSSLLSTVAAQSERHLIEAEADLRQTTFLLNTAIENLGASFETIHQVVAKQQHVLDYLISCDSVTEGVVLDISLAKQKMSEEINQMMTDLQFQDMTSQLINRAINHLVELKSLMVLLAASSKRTEFNSTDQSIQELFNEMHADICAKLPAISDKSVNQLSMSPGEISLF